MDTSELSNENNPDFNVLNTTVSASAVAHALHNINMDAILFRAKTEPNLPIVVAASSTTGTHLLTPNELVQAVDWGQSIITTIASGASGTNQILSFGSDTSANALALLQLLNLNKLTNPTVRLNLYITPTTTSVPVITSTPGSSATYVVSPATVSAAATAVAGNVVHVKLTAMDLSTYNSDGTIATPKVQFYTLG